MNTTTVVLTAVVFALVSTLVFAAIAPYLSTGAHATVVVRKCPPNSPEGRTGSDGPGCSAARLRAQP